MQEHSYQVGQCVAFETDEGAASRMGAAIITGRDIDNAGRLVYTVELPRLYEDEEWEALIIREDEVLGLND